MPPPHPRAAKDVAIKLRAQGIYPTEITRRLNEDQAGLGYAVAVSKRTIQEWLSAHRRVHGPLDTPAPEDVDRDAIAKRKAQAFALVCRELDALERRAKGKLDREQARTIRQHYETLDSMERIEEKAAKRRRQPSRAKLDGAPEPPKPDDAVSALAAVLAAEQDGNGEQSQQGGAGQETAHADLPPDTRGHRTAGGLDEARAAEQGNGQIEQGDGEGAGVGSSSPEPSLTPPTMAHIR